MKLSLLSKFTLVSFVLMAIIAVSLAWGIQQQLEQTALWQEATSAADEVTGILNPNLEKTDLTAPLDPARYAEIDALIRQNILHEHIVRVKIWSRDGLLLYSDQQDLVGQSYPLSDELAKALKGQIATDISTLDKPENAQQAGAHSQRLLEVYVPLRPMGSPQVLGAYEIYHDLTVVESSAASISRFVWSEVGVG
ncbi:MAG: hypothetical protein HY259_10960, partial [Chloroflexi bacterium]|nr:hypothetical protein [Chloroflexota bacterium]